MASTVNITLTQGEAAVFDVVISLDGSAYDLTGATGTDLTYRIGVRGDEDQVDLELGSGLTLGTAADGEVTVTVAATLTDDLAPGQLYRHELWLDDGTYEVPVITGTVKVLDSLHVAG